MGDRETPQIGVMRGAANTAFRNPCLQFPYPFQQITGREFNTVKRVGLGIDKPLCPKPQALRALRPALQQLTPFFQKHFDSRTQRHGRVRGRPSIAKQASTIARQHRHILVAGKHEIHLGMAKRIHLLSPVVRRRFQQQRGFVGLQLFVEQRTAVEGVFTQHALAPGIDGKDRRVVHRLCRTGQPPRRVLAFLWLRVSREQALQECVIRRRRLRTAETGRGLHEARANAMREFPRRGLGERHDQHLGGQQRGQGCTTMAQHQPYVQCGNGEGLASTGARFDEASAEQRQSKRVEVRWWQLSHRLRSPRLQRRCRHKLQACPARLPMR